MLAVCDTLDDLGTARFPPDVDLAAAASSARVGASNAAAAAAAASASAADAEELRRSQLAVAETKRALRAAEAKIASMAVPLPTTWTKHGDGGASPSSRTAGFWRHLGLEAFVSVGASSDAWSMVSMMLQDSLPDALLVGLVRVESRQCYEQCR